MSSHIKWATWSQVSTCKECLLFYVKEKCSVEIFEWHCFNTPYAFKVWIQFTSMNVYVGKKIITTIARFLWLVLFLVYVYFLMYWVDFCQALRKCYVYINICLTKPSVCLYQVPCVSNKDFAFLSFLCFLVSMYRIK